MNVFKATVKNNKPLVLVFLTYIGLSIVMPDKAVQSLANSLYYVKEMLLIMPVILLLTSLITAWVPRKTIENNFGKNSGYRGSVFSFLLGSFSAGPIYAAFPVCKMLLKKGASISNIVIILSTWAVIKVPMLINEVKFLGLNFMVIRWILTTAAIFIMGYVTSKLVQKDEIPMDDVITESKDNQLNINQDYCIGCGLCAKLAPDSFEIINKKAVVITQAVNAAELQAVNNAIEKCPTKIIKYTGSFNSVPSSLTL